MGALTLEVLGGYHYASKSTDAVTRWKKIHLIKNKHDAVASLNLFNQAVLIPSGSCIQRIPTDKRGEYTSKEFENYCRQTGILQDYAFTATPQQVGVFFCSEIADPLRKEDYRV